ncbi:MAG: ABC transporter ATP-binding protein/permease [Bacteroidales bacterium]|nr:ABC transporter ATP-binding protein/permease [Bacteroidales bacterium]
MLPYKWFAGQNILFNILAAIFSLFTFYLIQPFLKILFSTVEPTRHPGEFEVSREWFGDILNYYMGSYIDKFGEVKALVGVCLLVIGASFLRNIFVFAGNNALAYLRAGTVKDMRKKLYDKVLRLPVSYFTESRKGDVMTRISNDVEEIQVSVMGSLTMLFRDPVTIIIFLTFLFISSFKLTLFSLILMPLSGWLIGRVGRNLRSKSFRGQENLGKLISVVEETLGGLRIIKAFNAEGKMKGIFDKTNNFFTKLYRRVLRRRYMASPLSEFLSTTVLMGVMYFGSTIVLTETGEMTPEQLIVFLAVFSQLIPPVKNITTMYFNVQKGLASLERIEYILNAEERIEEKKNAVPVKSFNEEIRYDSVSFAYTDDYVLEDISLSIKKGQTVAIVGKSGSGKSTMVDLLPRFMDVNKGSITIDGIDIRDMKIRDLRNIMGIVNQTPILFNDSFRNNIAFGSDLVSDEDIERAAKVANAHDFIMESPGTYDYMVGERGNKLSGGQQQRISIARAVYANPPILILDEATSALDTESERLVQDAIERLMQSRTSIVIAHRLSTVQRADQIVVIDEGRIVEHGSHEELMSKKNGLYKKFYNMQMT